MFFCRLDIEQCDDCGCDSLTFAFNDSSRDPRAPWRKDKECGRLTFEYLEFLHMLDGDPNKRFSAKELYVRFSSDDSVNYKGFNFTFVAKTDSCKLSRPLFLLRFVTVTPFCLKYVIIAPRFHPGKNTSPPPPILP